VTLLGSEAVRFAYEKREKARGNKINKKGKPFFSLLTISFLTVAALYSLRVRKGEEEKKVFF
jgi:hypothetical protein